VWRGYEVTAFNYSTVTDKPECGGAVQDALFAILLRHIADTMGRYKSLITLKMEGISSSN
jgi:hypothetical protein